MIKQAKGQEPLETREEVSTSPCGQAHTWKPVVILVFQLARDPQDLDVSMTRQV